MNALSLALIAAAVGTTLFFFSSKRYAAGKNQGLRYRSQAMYYSCHTTIWCTVPALVVMAIWLWAESRILEHLVSSAGLTFAESKMFLEQVLQRNGGAVIGSAQPSAPEVTALAETYTRLKTTSRMALSVLFLAMVTGGAAWGISRVKASFNAQYHVEKTLELCLLLFSAIAVLVTIGIVLSVLFESLRFFQMVSPIDFFFGDVWSPQTAIREDQVGSSGAFGAVPLFVGTFLVSAIAMFVAVPVGLMAALYLSEFAPAQVRNAIKPILEILAGIPTVVYGFFAALAIAPFIRGVGTGFGLDVSSESALAAGLVMGIMIIPFVSSLSDDAVNAVPQSLREASYGLGATQTETITKVILPAALPGIVSSVLLAVSRAIGETMIVVMAAGFAANLTLNPLESVTTVTVQIVALLTGDQEFDSAKTLSAFALGLTLFFITLLLNAIALATARKYHEKYE